MTFKVLPALLTVVMVLSLPIGAQAQKNEQDKAAPKPTKADVRRVVDIISGDPAKIKTYCGIAEVGDQIDQAFQKKDEKSVDALSQKMDAMSATLGPEYIALMDGLEELEPDSEEAQDIGDMFEPLDAMCEKK
ncbi:MAG: hypothetical protein K9G60_06785 [Pseudolabrys sp.]|nr:hypothetical protein [Pseudolabrys sp.]